MFSVQVKNLNLKSSIDFTLISIEHVYKLSLSSTFCNSTLRFTSHSPSSMQLPAKRTRLPYSSQSSLRMKKFVWIMLLEEAEEAEEDGKELRVSSLLVFLSRNIKIVPSSSSLNTFSRNNENSPVNSSIRFRALAASKWFLLELLTTSLSISLVISFLTAPVCIQARRNFSAFAYDLFSTACSSSALHSCTKVSKERRKEAMD